MAKKHRGDDVAETRRSRRYTTGRVDTGPEADGVIWPAPDDELIQASLEDLHEFADELQIEDYETLSRDELVREIRRQTRAEP